MKLVRCSKGHFYDEQNFKSCPHCENIGIRGINPTMPLKLDDPGMDVTISLTEQAPTPPVDMPTPKPKTIQPVETLQEAVNAAAKNTNQSILPNIKEDSKTVYFQESKGKNKEPVVGWLVCVEGEHLGDDFKIITGRNFIGRAPNMDIALTDDKGVSREKHAIIIYEPRKNIFLVQPGESNGLCYLNDDLLLQPQEIKARDILLMGETKLMLIPLCGEDFNWSNIIKKEDKKEDSKN